MNKLTGNGRPTMNTPGEVGQYYEDLNTGDIYECRRSSKYSPTHGAPVGGYWWELRASGENIREHGDFYGGGSGGAGNLVISVKELDNRNSTINSANMTYAEIKAAIEAGTLENITVKFPEEDGIIFASSVYAYIDVFFDAPAISCTVTAHRNEYPTVYYVHVFENNQIYAYEQD